MYQWQIHWEDYYEALGIERTATQAEIKKAFRSKAREWHIDPYEGGGASESVKAFADTQFKLCNNANATLTSAVEKREYDREWEKREKAKTSSTGPRPSSADDRPEDPPRPTTPSPSKDYYPIVDVDTNEIRIEVEQGSPVSFSFIIRHVSGELPPKWNLGIKLSEVWLDKANFSMSPADSFPAKVSVSLPPQPVGEHYGSITVSVEEVK